MKNDETIIIGNSKLYIFYELNTCSVLLNTDEKDLFAFNNKKIHQLLKVIEEFSEAMFLWLDNVNNLDYYYTVLESFLADYQQVVILAN